MKRLHPSSYFLVGFATAMLTAFLLTCVISCQSPPPPDEIDRALEAAISRMFTPEGKPR